MDDNKINIGGRLHSIATGNVIAGADEILDDTQNKKQQDINAELIEAVSTVNSRIAAAVNAEKTRAEGEESTINGKITTEKTRAEAAEGALDGRVDILENAVGTGGSIDSRISDAIATETTRAQAAEADRYTKSETYTKEEVHNLITTPNQKYVSVTATDQTTAVTDVLPATGAADTTYRVGNWDGTQYNDSVFSEYAWNGSAYIKLSTKSQIGEVYDISANHADTKYVDLAAALGTNGANVPSSIRKGGMSIKFVNSSDNKYVQYRLMATSWSINTDDWSFCGNSVYVENPEWIYVLLDANGRILAGLKSDGSVEWFIGIPTPVKTYIDNAINEIKNGTEVTGLDGLNKIIAFLSEFSTSDTLKDLLDAKVDKEEDKSLIDTDYAESMSSVENSEWMDVKTDSKNRILEGIKSDGTKVISGDLNVGGSAKILGNMKVSGVSYSVIENSEYIAAWVDAESKIIFGIKTDGKTYVGDADFLNDIKDNQEAINRIEELINSIDVDVDNIKDSIVHLNSVTDTLSEDVELLKSHSSGGVSFSTNFILSDSIQGNDLFIQNNTLIADGGSTEAVQGYSSTSFANIMGIIYLEYDNLHAIDIQNGYYPIFLYDKDFNYLDHADVVVNQSKNTAGSLDLSVYPTAAYAIFCNDSDANLPSIQMFTRTEKIKNERNNILVGAYYFAGWSEIDFPNIHHTEDLLNTYNGRKPIWGWLDHASVKGEGWLITPQINLNGGTSELTIVNSCLFHTSEQCKVYVKEVGNSWIDKTPVLPSATKTTMSTTTIDISEFVNKSIQIGFKLKTSPDEQSAIWTINRITVTSNGSSVYDRDYTDHSNFDCEITDFDVWKPATWTRAYSTLNGYVGTTVNQKDTSVIDKQIVLAKQHGIDYFMLEWFYYDDQSTFNEQASYNEDNHIGVHAFMNSCQKLGFRFALMITNHSPFRIVGLQNWKDAIAYLDREYFRDPSYLVVDNKPVIYIFNKTEYRAAGTDAINDYFIELGWSGAYVLFTNYNSIPNTGQLIERDITDLYNVAKQWNIDVYKGNHQYNFVAHTTCGWDTRPWAVRPAGYARPTDWFIPDINKWRNLFDWLYRFAKVYNNGKFRALLICAWNEYGEGSYLAPTEDDKRGQMLLTIGDTINKYKY